MSAAQTLLFVALPNGAPGDKPRISVYLAPRLSGAPILADFPDMLDWTDLIVRHGLKFTFAIGGATHEVQVDRAPLRPDLWKDIFKPPTHVADFPRPDFDKRLVISYPARTAHDFLLWGYGVAATRASTGDLRLLNGVLQDLAFRDGQLSTLDKTLSDRRLALWKAQTAGSDGPPGVKVLEASPPGPPQKPAATREMVERFALYHRMPPAPGRPPLPSTAADFEKVLDFHKAVSALNAYPRLMRALGLVFDIALPDAFVTASPATAGGDYGAVTVSAVTPGWTWHVKPTLSLPQTAYVRDAKAFAAAPATPSSAVATGAYEPSDVGDGFLAMNPSDFALINVELDGAMLKALTLADNVAAINDPSRIDQVLPSLRSGGFSLIADDRAQEVLRAIADNTEFLDAETSGGQLPRPFDARDVTRGYRLDVWSSQDGAWHSLHRRDGTYAFGADGGLVFSTSDEEGFIQLGVASPADDPTRGPDPASTAAGAPQPGTDLFVNERIARWNGWSLSAPRPGRPLNRSSDPNQAADEDPSANAPITPFKMKASFKANAGSLPRLRFGARYRIRARAVDLAGNSPGLGDAAPASFILPAGAPSPYFRFEPVPPPVVVPRAPPTDGATLLRLVIRTYNSAPALDRARTLETDERHLVPPKADVLTVERHGMLDAAGKLKAEKATYDLVVERDKGVFATVGTVPVAPAATAVTPWFPDPIARGVALRDLPGTPDNTNGAVAGGALRYVTPPDVETRPGSVTKIDFGEAWPGRQPVRLILAEGRKAPEWNDAERTLTVFLSKAQSVDLPVSSYLDPADLELMGVWDWMRVWFEGAEAGAMANDQAGLYVVETADARGQLTRLALEGGHEMLTPPETLSLTHAVQQPIGHPTWSLLPIAHNPGSPAVQAALRNGFSPITAWRSLGSHHAVLLGGLRIHGASTARIDIQASWTDVLDDLAKPGPTRRPAADHVEVIEVKSLAGGMLAADGKGERFVASYIPQIDTLWFAAPFDVLQGVDSPSQVAAPVHQFGDTRHRRVDYHAVAASRFQEYFPEPGLVFSRAGAPLRVSVPSSARPASPTPLYVVPTFGWERQESTNVKTEIRQGNGLRVYLARPWYSSGEGELLGVVLWPDSQPAPTDAQRDTYKTWFTQWGLDPIWGGGQLDPFPATYSFTLAKATGQNLTLEATDLKVDVAGHEVGYDAERRLWFCDIELGLIETYAPFIRLALARYQPSSIAGTELSHVVLTDFAQLTPDRAAALTVDPASPSRGRLFVGGTAPTGPTRALITVTVETREPAIGGDLGWREAHPSEGRAIEDSPAPNDANSTLWQGAIVFSKRPANGEFRVIIREFEILPVDPPPNTDVIAAISHGERLVYASIIPWTFEAS
jgi:hypothetical protein